MGSGMGFGEIQKASRPGSPLFVHRIEFPALRRLFRCGKKCKVLANPGVVGFGTTFKAHEQGAE